MDIWQKYSDQRRKKEKQGNISSATRKNIQPRTVERNSQ